MKTELNCCTTGCTEHLEVQSPVGGRLVYYNTAEIVRIEAEARGWQHSSGFEFYCPTHRRAAPGTSLRVPVIPKNWHKPQPSTRKHKAQNESRQQQRRC